MANHNKGKNEDKIEAQIEERSKQINYRINEYTVGFLADEMQKGDDGLFYVPEYQRNFVWDSFRRSRFIESLVMGLPIPFIFYYENTKTGKLEIVDGSQRMRTIYEFIHNNMKLIKLERLTELSGKSFQNLSEPRQRKIKNKSIRGIVLDEHADNQARYDLFNRINTGSKEAESAEIRRGSLQGVFMTLIIDLAEKKYFKELIPMSQARSNSREYEELVTRFFAYGDGLKDYHDVVETFLFQYVDKMNKKMVGNKELVKEYEKRLEQTMNCVKQMFPLGFRKKEGAGSIPRVRFESIAVGTYLALKQVGDMKKLRKEDIEQWIECEEYRKILRSDAANVRKKLNARIGFVKEHLIGE